MINIDAEPSDRDAPGEVYFDLPRLRSQFHDYVYQKANEIEEQKESRRYFHCVQWTKEQMDAIRARGQPVTTKNEFERKVNAIVGLLERLKQDPKGYPNSPKHMDGADVATATLRYALASQQWEAIMPKCGRHGAIDGVYGVEFDIVPGDVGDPEIGLGLIQPDTFFYDPRSFEDDFSDAMFMGTSKWVDIGVLKAKFPEKADEIDSMLSTGSEFTISSDRDLVWSNSRRRTLRAVDHWYRAGDKWRWCFHIGAIKLAEGDSPWIDERGQSQHKYEVQSSNVDHEGDRYGFLRNLKTSQDEINQRTSRLLHISNSRRIIARENAVKNVEVARREWARADGWITISPTTVIGQDIMADNTTQDFQGQLLLLQEAKQDMAKFGPNASQLGQGDTGRSGRAIALLQQAGLAELGPFIIGFRSWKLRIYRKMWNAIQRHWQAERWIRVTDSEGLAQFIQLNGLEVDEYNRPAIVNAVGSLDVDITLDESGDVVTTMVEALETLQSAMAAGMQMPPDILVDLLPIRQDIKNKLRERMQQAQQPDPMQQQAKQIALQQEQAKTGKIRADTFKATADAVEKVGRHAVNTGTFGAVMPNAQPKTPGLPLGPMPQLNPEMLAPRFPMQQQLPL